MFSKFDAFPAGDATVRHQRGVNRVPAGVISRHPARNRTIGLQARPASRRAAAISSRVQRDSRCDSPDPSQIDFGRGRAML